MSLRRFLATSDATSARLARAVRRRVMRFSLPLPVVVIRPVLWIFLAVRQFYYFVVRVFVAEPLFKAYCTRYGRGLRTGVFVHWVQGRGEILIGDDVRIDGKSGFTFAARFADRPRLTIGDRTGIMHNCSFAIAKEIRIGRDCMIANDVVMFDSSGHPADPRRRRAGEPPAPDDVKPIVIGDNVWIGRGAIIFPGVTIGDDSIVSAGSVVVSNVPPAVVVAGNPARRIAALDSAPADR